MWWPFTNHIIIMTCMILCSPVCTKISCHTLTHLSKVFHGCSNLLLLCWFSPPLPPGLLVTVVSAGNSTTRPGPGKTLLSTEQCSETSESQRRDSKTSRTSSSYCKSQTFAISWRTSGEVRVHWAQWGTCLNWLCLAGRRRSTGHHGTAYY